MSKSAHITLLFLLIGYDSSALAGSDDPCDPSPRIDLTTVYEGWHAQSMNQAGAQMPASAAPSSYQFKYRTETKFKDGQIRVCFRSAYESSPPSAADDSDQEICTLYSASGDVVMLMPPTFPNGTPVYFKQSASDRKRQREMFGNGTLQTASANLPALRPETLSRTDQTRLIDGRNAVLHVGYSANGNTRFEEWITSDIDGTALIQRAQDCASRRIDPLNTGTADSDVPGLSVESRVFFGDEQTSEMRLVSISREPIPDEVFRIPSNYRSMQDAAREATKGMDQQGIPAFPGMPDIPGVPVQR